ncbi:2'-5' RNA ligase family protein [Streptomyces chiangmaiensis]|uniref:2'-5' RNA ligase family protein n=1 Tax=Streptomyces chiangmaiensis TaxID=766497 RepID=A0ABU7FGG9_9ACTN|nr:2'-5' RNA ligase family protein [Streptomyces chiangmaiensis]MED7823211.1 2'-5' RNA ligase family protein [Streptomyces chiangmaiensis]
MWARWDDGRLDLVSLAPARATQADQILLPCDPELLIQLGKISLGSSRASLYATPLDDPEYVAFTQAHHDLLTEYGDRVGIVPAPWLHWTAQGVHHQLDEVQVERAVQAAREAAQHAAPATVTMGPVWPGPSAVTVAMYPEEPLAAINALVRNAVSTVPGVQLREAGDRYWPHSTLAYFRAPDVHDSEFNRRLRKIRPDRVEITISRLLAVYMHQSCPFSRACAGAVGSTFITTDSTRRSSCGSAASSPWASAAHPARSVTPRRDGRAESGASRPPARNPSRSPSTSPSPVSSRCSTSSVTGAASRSTRTSCPR